MPEFTPSLLMALTMEVCETKPEDRTWTATRFTRLPLDTKLKHIAAVAWEAGCILVMHKTIESPTSKGSMEPVILVPRGKEQQVLQALQWAFGSQVVVERCYPPDYEVAETPARQRSSTVRVGFHNAQQCCPKALLRCVRKLITKETSRLMPKPKVSVFVAGNGYNVNCARGSEADAVLDVLSNVLDGYNLGGLILHCFQKSDKDASKKNKKKKVQGGSQVGSTPPSTPPPSFQQEAVLHPQPQPLEPLVWQHEPYPVVAPPCVFSADSDSGNCGSSDEYDTASDCTTTSTNTSSARLDCGLSDEYDTASDCTTSSTRGRSLERGDAPLRRCGSCPL